MTKRLPLIKFKKTLALFTAEETSNLPRWVVLFAFAVFFVLFWYIGLRYFIFSGAAYGADNSSHLAEIVKIASQLRSWSFDFWFEQVNLGYPLFTGYNVLPYVLMGTVIALTESDPMQVYNASIILLFSIVPCCWYYAARLMQLSRLVALMFALMPICLSDYTNFGLTIGSVMSMGLYSQLWAMPLFPIVIACYYRLLIIGASNSLWAVIISHSLLSSIHTLLSLLTGLAGFLLFILHQQAWRRQIVIRYLVTQLSVVVLFSHWLVSYLPNRDFLVKLYATNHPFSGPELSEFIDLLAGGKIFDFGYPLPVLTIFLVIGLLVCARGMNFLRGWAVYFLVIGLILFLFAAGDHLAGSILPFVREIPFRRYLPIIHLSGGLIIAWGVGYLLMKISRLVNIITGIAMSTIIKDLVIALIILLVIDRYFFAKSLFRTKVIDDNFYQLSQKLNEEPTARFLVHNKFRTSSHFYRNLLPLMADRPQMTSYARGIRDTISFYYTDTFNFSRASYELFNIRHLVSRVDIPLQDRPGFLLQQRLGDYRLYRAEGEFSNFAFIDSSFAVSSFTERAAINYLRHNSDFFYHKGNMPILVSEPPNDRPHVTFTDGKIQHFLQRDNVAVQVDGQQFAQQIFIDTIPTDGQLLEGEGYRVLAKISSSRYLLLKVSYHPNWQVTVNGQPQKIQLVAPNFMAVYLTAGEHEVIFSYRSPKLPQILFLVTMLFWAGAGFCFVRRAMSPTLPQLRWFFNFLFRWRHVPPKQ